MSTSASRRWPNPPLVAPPSSSGWATRSPSSRRISTRRPRGCSSSSASSTRVPAGTPASARAPSGCRGGSGSTRGAARERVRVARALATLPRLAQALARGELSYAKVRALTRVATPETEERLLAVGRAGTACHVERIVRGWRRVDRIAEARETALRHNRRALRVYQNEDGMVVVRGRLAPEAGAVLLQALAAARETLYQQRRQTFDNLNDVSAETPPIEQQQPPIEQQQADALTLLAESALHHGIDPGAPGERYQVVVHVDAPVLADSNAPGQSVLEDGAH